jgi:DNA polymerase-3 subunit chi
LTAASCDIWFYHLERSPLEEVLPGLLEKTLGRGWRALVRGGDPARLRALDTHLWTWREDSFLPHGLDDEPMADRQPVLLTDKLDNPNGGQALFILLFDGRDEEALRLARGRWKAFKGAGHPVSYWRQGAERGWEKQA